MRLVSRKFQRRHKPLCERLPGEYGSRPGVCAVCTDRVGLDARLPRRPFELYQARPGDVTRVSFPMDITGRTNIIVLLRLALQLWQF